MQPVATAAQMRELDRIAIQERGVPSLDLMENAARAVAEAVMDLAPLPGRAGADGPNASRFAAVTFVTGEGEPSDEDQRQMEAVRAIVESKNADPTPRIAVFCGPGNNGGDGFAAARLLLKAGYQVHTYFLGDRAKMTHDANVNAQRLECCGGNPKIEPFRLDLDHPEALDNETRLQLAWLSTCDCAVDALFGVGLSRPVEGLYRSAIQYLNRMGPRFPVVACDIPSGVHTDTGEVLGEAVNAAVTVTFTCGKPGLYLGEGAAHAGEVRVADIGIPRDLEFRLIHRAPERVEAVQAGEFRLPRRPRAAHKGDFGKVFVLAGSVGYTGAPVLAANAAVRAGAGLVYLGVPKEIWPIMAVKCTEAMPFPLPEDYDALLEKARSCDAALIGPGLGRAPETETLVLRLLADLPIPVVLDADGINALSGHIDVLDKRSAPTVLTPHDGEFSRLTGCDLPIRDRLAAARDFAKAHNCVLVLKGHGTVTAAPDGLCSVNTTGNPGMAKGGSGDVLAGIVAALLAQKPLNGPYTGAAELAAAGVCYHGMAGDRAAERLGEYGMTPSDLLLELPGVLRDHTERDQTI